MTILFKGFKIDWNNCDDCPASCDCPVCQHIDGYSMYGGRPNECPAFELPPHERLIDVNETVAQLQEMIDVVEEVYPLDGRERQLGIEKGLRDARRFIVELAPTVIEAEGVNDSA